MCKLDIIRTILHEEFKPENQNELSEEDIDAKGNKFTTKYAIVSKPNIDFVLFRYGQAAFPFFADVTGLKKMCDYILFAEENNFLYIFVIELKKGNDSAKKQLKAASEFVHFIRKSAIRIGNSFGENSKIIEVRICDQKVKRRTTKPKIEVNATNYCEYNLGNFYLDDLINASL